jgi:hypothetical protein
VTISGFAPETPGEGSPILSTGSGIGGNGAQRMRTLFEIAGAVAFFVGGIWYAVGNA